MIMFEDIPVRYPYLVPPLDGLEAEPDRMPPVIEPTATSLLLEDVDMQDVNADNGVNYIALDTNIFIHHLRLVQSLHDVLSSMSPVSHNILVPSVVINELDRLKLSDKPSGATPEDGNVTLGQLAIKATHWLLDANRRRRETGHGVVRCQKWVERLNENLDKADDRILDCCLYFRARAEVVLWSNDRNLSLLSETNDIQAVGGHTLRLQSLLALCGIRLPQAALDELDTRPSTPAPVALIPQTDEMEVDEDLYRGHSSLSDIAPTPLATPRISPSRLTRRADSTNSIALISAQAAAKLTSLVLTPQQQLANFRPLLLNLTTLLDSAFRSTRPSLPRPDQPALFLQDLIDLLITAEKTVGRSGDTHIDILRTVSAFRTILAFVDESHISIRRRPRIGEVADETKVIGKTLYALQVVDSVGQRRLMEVSDAIRLL